jgi:aromatic-amino-acid transaminase
MEHLIASRRARPGDDPIFSLHAQACRRAAAGEDIINATIGALLHDDGTLALMPSVVETLASIPADVVAGYAPIAGREEFRQAVIHELLGAYDLAGQAVAVATPGGSGALRIAFDDFLEQGQAILTSSFFWEPYKVLADESGRAIDTFNMFDAAGRYDTASLDEVLGRQMKRQGRAVVVLNTPCHNPTGYSLDAREWAETAALLRKHGTTGPVTALLDVAYSHYAEEGLSVALEALKEIVGDVLVLFAWSASKSFALYGLRVGALVAVEPDEAKRATIERAITYSCRGLWSNCNAGGMAAVAKILGEPALHARVVAERRKLAAMLAERVALFNELGHAAGLRFPRYDGGFFTTVLCDESVAAAATLRARGIFLVPVDGALRVAMCSIGATSIRRIVEALADVLGR